MLVLRLFNNLLKINVKFAIKKLNTKIILINLDNY